MIYAAFYDRDGNLRNFIGAPTEAEIKAQVREGDSFYIVPPQVAMTLPVDIEPLRAMLREKIKVDRDAAQQSGCDTPLGRVDTSTSSQLKILGAVVASQMSGPDWSIEWTMQDNSVAMLDGQSIGAIGLAVSSHIDACHQYGRALVSQLGAVDAIPDAYAVIENASWPS